MNAFRTSLADLRVKLKLGNTSINANADGVIDHKFKAGDILRLMFGTKRDDILAFDVGQDGDITPMYDYGRENLYLRGRDMTIGKSKNGNLFPQWPNNAVRIVELTNTGFVMYHLGVVAQYSRFWLVWAPQYTAEVYNDNGHLRCPRFDGKWPELTKLLDEQVYIGHYPDYASYTTANDQMSNLSGLAEGTAVVDWFNPINGFGSAIASDGSRIRLWWQELPRGKNGHRRVAPGDVITWSNLIATGRGEGLQANNVRVVAPATI